jgi:hypothetical protein
MEPVFTLPYSEYLAANLLSHHFKAKAGCSIFVPVSRQEKGVDILLTKRSGRRVRCASFQVKASRTYSPAPPKRKTTAERYSYYTWFNTFPVPNEADFFLLVGIYPAEENRTRKVSHSWWNSVVLMFTQGEMRTFISELKTKRAGKPDTKFGFGFNSAAEIILTRGDQNRTMKNYSPYLFQNRVNEIENFLLTDSDSTSSLSKQAEQ